MSTTRAVFVGLLAGLLIGTVFGSALERRERKSTDWVQTVESFTADLTITIECSGDCDLEAMIAEAREAVEK